MAHVVYTKVVTNSMCERLCTHKNRKCLSFSMKMRHGQAAKSQQQQNPSVLVPPLMNAILAPNVVSLGFGPADIILPISNFASPWRSGI